MYTDHYTSPPPPPTPPIPSSDSQLSTVVPMFHPWEESTRWWYAVAANQQIPIHLGKGGKKHFIISPVEVMHTGSTVGYIISERRTKIIPEVMQRLKSECCTQKDLGAKLQTMRTQGEEAVDYDLDIPICAFICDTTAAALTTGMHASQILAAPVIMIECTYLEESFAAEANRKGHVVWSGIAGLCCVVRERIKSQIQGCTTGDNKQQQEPQHQQQHPPEQSLAPSPTTFVLIHFSLRYSDSEIIDFFLDVARVGLGSAVATEGFGPPHIVLWLDSGIVQLWYSC